jgi:hypothetical protein
MLNVAHLDERIEKCLSILADNPYSQVFAALAEAYRKRGDFGRAFSVCKSGLKHHPDYAPAHIVMAKLYLHQGMQAEALASIERAVTIDGTTRATDFVEAETRLAMQDAEGARPIIDRLRATDRHDPVIQELCQRLKALKSAAAEMPPAASPPDADAVAPSREPQLSEPKRPTDWAEWVEMVRSQPHVERAFVFVYPHGADETAHVKIETPSVSASAPVAPIGAALFMEVNAILQRAGIGVLEEIRIERPDGQVWCRRRDDHLIGFAGRAGMSFGAVRQTALDAAERIHVSTTDMMPITRGESLVANHTTRMTG